MVAAHDVVTGDVPAGIVIFAASAGIIVDLDRRWTAGPVR
jgi:hypothetical protein